MMSQFESEEIHFERDRVVLEVIKNNPESHHNELIKIVVPRYMAKTTFEKTKNRLLDRNVLSVSKIKNKNFYKIAEDHSIKFIHIMERITHENYQHLQHEIRKIVEEHSRRDIDEKISTCSKLLNNLLQIDNGFTILDSVKNSKKTLYKDEHQEIQKMIAEIFKIISADRNFCLIYPIIMKPIASKIFIQD